MTEKRFTLVKCYNEQWGVVDKSLEEIDQLVLITTSKSGTLYLVNELNALHEENITLKSSNLEYEDTLARLEEEKQRLYEDNIRVKQLITEAHSNERTAIGRSVLLQIIEQL